MGQRHVKERHEKRFKLEDVTQQAQKLPLDAVSGEGWHTVMAHSAAGRCAAVSNGSMNEAREASPGLV
jgi:hypothetical protein